MMAISLEQEPPEISNWSPSSAYPGQPGELIADVTAFGNYAYLANWGVADYSGQKQAARVPDAGAWVIDISNPAEPNEVAFIPMPQDTRPREGMRVVHIETSKFKGDVLVMNAEACGKNYKGEFMLYHSPIRSSRVKLKEGFGDRTGSDAHRDPQRLCLAGGRAGFYRFTGLGRTCRTSTCTISAIRAVRALSASLI